MSSFATKRKARVIHVDDFEEKDHDATEESASETAGKQNPPHLST